jgi:hypothetical protein
VGGFFVRAQFSSLRNRFSTEVFNISVENAVEKRVHVDVNGSSSDGSALCTGVVAGTLVV